MPTGMGRGAATGAGRAAVGALAGIGAAGIAPVGGATSTGRGRGTGRGAAAEGVPFEAAGSALVRCGGSGNAIGRSSPRRATVTCPGNFAPL